MLIGVDDYSQLNDLEFAGADQKALSDEVIRAGFPADQVFLLHDGAKEKKYLPFRENIERQLELILGLAEKGDLVLVSFSGHGVWSNGQSWLCPTEARLDDPEKTMVSLDGIYDRLSKSKATLKLLLVDACRAVPPQLTGRRSAREVADANKALAVSFERPPEGIMLLASCAPGQISMEEKDFGHGVFMHYVLEGMRGKAADDDGNVSLTRLYDYASLNTKKYVARRFNDYQTPALKGELNGPFEIARIDRRLPALPIVPPRENAKPGETITNSLGMKLTLIPAGEFMMGSPATESGHDEDEKQHRVRITKPFYLGVYEVTQGEYEKLMGTSPSWFARGGIGKDKVAGQDTGRFPVETVSWDDAQDFCRMLSQKEGKTYRLPTEAEWEYACRAGTTTAYNTGGNGASSLDGAGWHQANSEGRTNLVGQKRANAFGLYDMHGNVWEWCSDWYGKDYYPASPADDPKGPSSGSSRVIRGGGWNTLPVNCRAASRFAGTPTYRSDYIGFRVVCER